MWFLNLIKSQFVSIRQCLTTSANSSIPNAEPKANSQQIHLFDCFLWPSRFWIWNVWPEASQSQVSPVWWWLDRGGCGCHKQPERALREKLQPLQATSTTLYWAEKSLAWGRLEAGCHHMLMIHLVLCWWACLLLFLWGGEGAHVPGLICTFFILISIWWNCHFSGQTIIWTDIC